MIDQSTAVHLEQIASTDKNDAVATSADSPSLAEVSDVLVRYATAIDSKDWLLFATCFSPDCTASYDHLDFPDAASLTSYMERVHRHLDSSLHRITNVALAPSEPRSSTSYVDALLIRSTRPAGPLRHVAGMYRDRWVRDRSEWRIGRRRYTSVFWFARAETGR